MREASGQFGTPSNIKRRAAVRERAVDDIAMAGDPADIGGAPIDLARLVIEHQLVGVARPEQIAARLLWSTPFGLPVEPDV
jgi:hypothetical protein